MLIKKNKPFIFGIILIIFFGTFIGIHFVKGIDFNRNVLYEVIYTPYGQLSVSNSGLENTYDKNQAETTVFIDYHDIKSYPSSISEGSNDEPNSDLICKIGGDYKVQVYSYPYHAEEKGPQTRKVTVNNCSEVPPGYSCIEIKRFGITFKTYYEVTTPPKFNETTTLFHCKTNSEIIRELKIPLIWKLDKLLLYCNDGYNIYDPNFNIDILTTKLNLYKVCILKNLDLKDNNTIIYGFEVGNSVIDDNKKYYFDTNNNTDILNSLSLISKPTSSEPYFTYEDKNNKKYYLKYNNISKMYTFYQGIKPPLSFMSRNVISTYILPYFLNTYLSKNIIARIDGNNLVVGYDLPLNQINSNFKNDINPVYIIKFSPTYGFTKEVCLKGLAKYNATLETLSQTTKVQCMDNEVLINGNPLALGKIKAYKLFMDIILNFKNN
jgi:hypothetical protein